MAAFTNFWLLAADLPKVILEECGNQPILRFGHIPMTPFLGAWAYTLAFTLSQ